MSSALKARSESIPVESKVDAKKRAEIAAGIGRALASTYVLYHKTHGFHWNVTGPLFYSVHKLTDDQYQDLAEAVDDLAERIRALGEPAPMGLDGYLRDSVVEDVNDFPDVEGMVKQLARDHLAVADQMRDIVARADSAGDVYSADLLTARIGVHEEAAWMLNAIALK
ncbi:Dps family protein [Maricaulis alexandrii]|jgi:starvation-inducible DNA-binding protein|uniref:Dps family protein n=1 Tax=Maricaulis alexandrii TaxID=2570354 RepID=UPI001107C522|nr:Dps family protein [Maricaulis alexandrii]